MVVSENVTTKPNSEEVTDERYGKKLVMKEFNKEEITAYIREKVAEAAKKESVPAAYEYLEEFFSVED